MKRQHRSQDMSELMERVDSMVSYTQPTKRSEKPHKALLLLLALSQFQKTQSSSLVFISVEPVLKKLIKKYSPSAQQHAEYPFWALQNDRLWEVFYESPLNYRKGKDWPPRSQLVKHNAVGKLPFWAEKVLGKKRTLVRTLANKLLDRYFDKKSHPDVLRAVGLAFEDDSAESKTTGLI
jgi:predicted restriction endonuclease